MRRVGGELLLLRERGVEARERRIQHRSKPRQLVAIFFERDALGEISGRDATGGGAYFFDRSNRASRQPPTNPKSNGKHRASCRQQPKREAMERGDRWTDIAPRQDAVTQLCEVIGFAKITPRSQVCACVAAQLRGQRHIARSVRRFRKQRAVATPGGVIKSIFRILVEQVNRFAAESEIAVAACAWVT